MYCECEEKLVEKVMLKYDIKFSITLADAIYDIIWFGGFEEKDFEKLVPYLKERATRDVYNREPQDESAMVDWTFYLRQYSYYIKNILHRGIASWDREKYLYPADVYDITYHHKNNREKFFLNYMEEKHPESTKQV